MKERVTFTLASDVLKQMDSIIDGYKIKNRSHAAELLLLKALKKDIPKTAVILAGGKGTRLSPITHEIPKPLLPLQGKPLVEHTLDLLKKYGITEVILAIGYQGQKIKDYFGDGRKFGLHISYTEEEKPLGTAGPLHLLKDRLTETFLLCNADELKDIDLSEMFLFHKDTGALATIALTTVEDPSAFGVARLQGNRIQEFIEKPKKGEAPSKLINSGLYILEPEILHFIPKGFAMIEKDVFPQVALQKKLFGYPFSGYWKPIGTLQQYEEALNDLQAGKFKL